MMTLNGTQLCVKRTTVDIGAFDIGYRFTYCNEHHRQPFIQDIIEWLSLNCTYNFIVRVTSNQLVAGGHVDNLAAWNAGRFAEDCPDRYATHDYEIRLSNYDNTAFSMRWITHD